MALIPARGLVRCNASAAQPISSAREVYARHFPNDSVTLRQLDQITLLHKRAQQHITVGITYNESTKNHSKVVEALLADPLAAGNEVWYDKIKTRLRESTNRFVEEEVPSPLLSTVPSLYKDAAVKNAELNDFDVFCPVELVENGHDTHYTIHVVNDYSEVTGQGLLTVVDNEETTPSSTLADPLVYDASLQHHVIKINSRLAYRGIEDFLAHDTEAASRYVEALQHSNIYELAKYIHLLLNTGVLGKALCNEVVERLRTQDVDDAEVAAIEAKDIDAFSTSMHAELQSKLVPETTAFLNSLKWWKLYLKNDNIEYDIKDFFNAHFMPSSIENYSYYRGQIISRLQQHHHGAYTGPSHNNPILEYKNDLVTRRVESEIQPVVYSLLVEALVVYQLPISAIAGVAYVWFGFSGEASAALALFGWVMGFSSVAKKWEHFTNAWRTALFEDVRLLIGKECIDTGLLRELKERVEEERRLVAVKRATGLLVQSLWP